MKLSHLLKPEGILLGLEAADKWIALDLIVSHLREHGELPEAKASRVLSALEERERSMSTGMEYGVAVPHTSVVDLPREVVALAVAPRGIPFESLGGTDVQILVCLITPPSRKLLHIRTLAEVARLLSHESIRTALLTAQSVADVLETIRRGETRGIDVA